MEEVEEILMTRPGSLLQASLARRSVKLGSELNKLDN